MLENLVIPELLVTIPWGRKRWQ